MQDLRMMSENECLCVLQAKSLMNSKLVINNKANILLNTSNNSEADKSTLNLNATRDNSLNSTMKLTQSLSSMNDTIAIENIDLKNEEDHDDGDEGDDEFDENESFIETERVQGNL